MKKRIALLLLSILFLGVAGSSGYLYFKYGKRTINNSSQTINQTSNTNNPVSEKDIGNNQYIDYSLSELVTYKHTCYMKAQKRLVVFATINVPNYDFHAPTVKFVGSTNKEVDDYVTLHSTFSNFGNYSKVTYTLTFLRNDNNIPLGISIISRSHIYPIELGFYVLIDNEMLTHTYF